MAKKSGADATLSDETWPQQHGNNLGLQSNRYINTNAMQISASLNLFGTQDVSALAVGSQTRPASNASKWVISPKFETPMLNFNSVSITTPTFASQSVPRGIWHQYGKPPTDDNTGVFMEITDVPEAWTTGRLGLNSKLTGSLADLCGFSKSPQRLGDARESKEIKEAIVVVPFVESDDGGRSFVSIDRNRINTALGDPTALFPAGDSIQDMVDRMQEYYLPPEFDFISDETLDPFAMYFLEFKHTLSKQDLTDIWQNLPPTIATSFEEKEVTYEHDINTQELLGNLMTITSLGTGPGTSELEGITNSDTMLQALSQLRFMVFKVKQRAASIYHEQTYIRTSDAPATSGTSARFNWPYDFFSLVEFGKVNFGFEIGAMNEVQEEDVLVNSPLPSVGSKTAGDATGAVDAGFTETVRQVGSGRSVDTSKLTGTRTAKGGAGEATGAIDSGFGQSKLKQDGAAGTTERKSSGGSKVETPTKVAKNTPTGGNGTPTKVAKSTPTGGGGYSR